MFVNIFQPFQNGQWDQQLMDQLSQLCKAVNVLNRFSVLPQFWDRQSLQFWAQKSKAQIQPWKKHQWQQRPRLTQTNPTTTDPTNHKETNKNWHFQAAAWSLCHFDQISRWWFQICFNVWPYYLGFHDPNWLICFKWVGSTTNCRFGSLRYGFWCNVQFRNCRAIHQFTFSRFVQNVGWKNRCWRHLTWKKYMWLEIIKTERISWTWNIWVFFQ